MASKNKVGTKHPTSPFRQRAEDLWLEKNAESIIANEQSIPVTPDLVHELQVHQIELEMQNDELHQAQFDLEESRARFEDLYDSAPVGYFTVSKEGLILQANLTLSALLGLARGELVKQPLTRFIHREDKDIFHLLRKRLSSSNPSIESTANKQTCELRMLRADGTTFWGQLTSVFTKSVNKDSEVLNVVLLDVTESRRVNDALKISENRFRDIAHISADWIWEVDSNAIYTYASQSVYTLLGYRPDEILGKTPFDFMPPDEVIRVGEEFSRIVATKSSFKDLENIVIGKDGTSHITLTNGTPILDGHGELLGYRGVDRDITRYREMEAEVRDLAFFDTLTKLPNRRLLSDRLTQSIAASKRSERYCALMFLDLDNFKQLNDSYGHEVGDLLLIEVSKRLQSIVREIDTVARYGGDEFVIILNTLNINRT